MISLTERTILDKRTLGCICDHGTTECKDIITLFESNRGYCSVYVCNKGLQEILRLTVLNDAMNCIDAFCHPEFISGSIQGGSLQFNTYKFSGLPRHCVARNDGATTRLFGLRPLNDGMDCHATAWLAMTDIVKPETDRNQIQNKLWQKQSNRNISTCVAQREVA